MNNSYPYVKLKELCDVNQGLQIPIEERFTENAPNRYFYITVQFLKTSHTNKFYVENPPSSSICNEDDILIVRTGSTGQIVTGVSGCFHNNFFKVNFNKELIHGRYLYHCLNTKEKYRDMLRRAGVTTIPDLNHFMFLDMEIPLPKKNNQIEIAKTLDCLDSKIELNNRINAELEAMAKTLYDYWFVQFDFPVPKDGRTLSGVEGYKTSGGKMVWNDELKREVPDGWEVGTLLNIADYINGLPCQKFRPTGDEFLRVIKIREMNEGFSVNSEFVSPDIPEKAIIENGDVLFSWSASLDVKIWTGGKGALNQHIFKVTSDKYPKSFYFYQLLNYLQHFKMMAENRKTTMGHITQEHLQQSRIAIPTEKLTLELEKIIAPIFKQKMVNEIQNQTLSTLRDWLLPMLMNGQVTIHTD